MRRGLACGVPETAFANREAFVADIRDGGIAAMELVARDLKSLGLYTARALSFAGVEYEILEHRFSVDQVAILFAPGVLTVRGRDLLDQLALDDVSGYETVISPGRLLFHSDNHHTQVPLECLSLYGSPSTARRRQRCLSTVSRRTGGFPKI
jgi:hypothetical protein